MSDTPAESTPAVDLSDLRLTPQWVADFGKQQPLRTFAEEETGIVRVVATTVAALHLEAALRAAALAVEVVVNFVLDLLEEVVAVRASFVPEVAAVAGHRKAIAVVVIAAAEVIATATVNRRRDRSLRRS